MLILASGLIHSTPMFAAEATKQTDKLVSDTLEPSYVSPVNGLGSWIWSEKTYDGQVCKLWRSLEIPEDSTVVRARLSMTVDNEFTLYLDGRELGRGAEWREIFVFELAPLLTPGQHILAVKAVNSFTQAGMLLGLEVELKDGRVIRIKSDASWRIVPDQVNRWETRLEAPNTWPAATIKQPFGGGPYWTSPLSVNMMPPFHPVKLYFWQTGWFQITLLSVSGIVILISLRLMAQLTLHRKERWLLQQERARIARDIHDDIGARMTQLVLHGEVAQGDLSDETKTRQQLVRICDEARGLLSTMDEVLWAVNPRRDTLRDFASYVCSYAQEFLKNTPIQCLFEVDAELSTATFDLPLRRSLLMAIKETLNNAVKYSKASELKLKIHLREKKLVVVVEDNGQGFDMANIRSGRNGLNNIDQRLKEMGGSCQITSRPGHGCRIEFQIPFLHSRRYPWSWLWTARPFSGSAAESRNKLPNGSAKSDDLTQC